MKQFFSQNQMNGCDCWGPDGRLDTKISHIDWCHISMSYASYDIKCHIMTNDAYDIEIWHESIWSTLVSKRPSGPQQSHMFIRFWQTNCLKIKKIKNVSEIFSLYKFWISFVFLAEKGWSVCTVLRTSDQSDFFFICSVMQSYRILGGVHKTVLSKIKT